MKYEVSAELLTALLEEGGFDPGVQCEPRLTTLSLAARDGHIPLVDAILAYARRRGLMESALDHCLDKNASCSSLVSVAICTKQLELLKHLVATVPELDLTRAYSLGEGRGVMTHVVLAAFVKNLPALRFLLAPERAADRGFPPMNEQDPESSVTLLYRAVAISPQMQEKLTDVAPTVEFLLQRGADPTIQDRDGHTPIDVARHNGLHHAVRLMEDWATKGEREAAVC